ncbi:hypothetical protein D3C72_2487020 [compost metagenome]
MVLTRTMPFSTAMPKRAMKPIDAETLRCNPRSHRAAMPPMVASGRIKITRVA